MLVSSLTLWRPLLPYGYSYKASVPDRVKLSFVIFWHPGTLTLSHERQSARISKITNDDLIRSGTWCFIAVPIWQQSVSKGLYILLIYTHLSVSSFTSGPWCFCPIRSVLKRCETRLRRHSGPHTKHNERPPTDQPINCDRIASTSRQFSPLALL